MIWQNSVFWILPKFMVIIMSAMMQTFVCLSITFNHALRDIYARGIIITVIKIIIFSLFIPAAWLTALLSCICSYLEAIFQISISIQTKNSFHKFLSNSAKNTDKFPGSACLRVFTNPLTIPLLFPCLLVTLQPACHRRRSCWSSPSQFVFHCLRQVSKSDRPLD